MFMFKSHSMFHFRSLFQLCYVFYFRFLFQFCSMVYLCSVLELNFDLFKVITVITRK